MCVLILLKCVYVLCKTTIAIEDKRLSRHVNKTTSYLLTMWQYYMYMLVYRLKYYTCTYMYTAVLYKCYSYISMSSFE